MRYKLPLQALVFRPVIRSDMPEEFLNKMNDKEILEWYNELRNEFLEQGLDESMPRWKLLFEEKIIERRDIYELFKENMK
jgi:hypothetical protein